MDTGWEQEFVETHVPYTLFFEGKLILVENVPARVALESGETFFAPETVERLQSILWEDKKPARIVETPVFEFAA